MISRLSLAGLLLCGFASAGAEDLDDLRAQLLALRAEQDRIAAQLQSNESALRAIEARIGKSALTTAAVDPRALSTSSVSSDAGATRWKFSGDIRVRGQFDDSDRDSAARDSAQLRARAGATYQATDRLRVGARLVTGDPDDPNSTDVQLSHWDDDLQVSLDLAYLQMDFQHLSLYAGKFPMLFSRTDLVWDGDVNPQGLGASFRRPLGDGSTLRGAATLMLIDEQVAGPDSTMAGLQLGYDSPAGSAWRFEASGGFYRHRLGSIGGADNGDFRSNLRVPAGTYVSDYEIVDLIAGATWQGADARWPARLVVDYARNLGADPGRDAALGIDLAVGRASRAGDWRVTYGYSRTDVDAVLAAFSHDNLGIATNYRLHAMTIDYTPTARTLVSGIWYRYRPNDPIYAAFNDPSDWLHRFRLYFQVSF